MKKFLVSGIAAGFAILVVSFVIDFLIVQVWPYDIFSLAGMRSAAAPEMALYFLYPFVLGLAMAYAYQFCKTKGKNYTEKGCNFGFLVWLMHGLTSFVVVYASMDYPTGFYVSSLVGSLVTILAAGLVIAKMSK